MKVVFHLNEISKVDVVYSNIRNILKLDVNAVVLVINGEAIKIFNNLSYDPEILDPRFKMYACQNSMTAYGISSDYLFSGTHSVVSGVYSLTQLQHDGYAYIKP